MALRVRSLADLGIGATAEQLRPQRAVKRYVDNADTLFWQMQGLQIHHDWVRDYRFSPPRKWLFDLALPHAKLAVEVDGFGKKGKQGGHQTIKGIKGNCEKFSEAACQGWRLIRVTSCQVKSGKALAWIERAMVAAEQR